MGLILMSNLTTYRSGSFTFGTNLMHSLLLKFASIQLFAVRCKKKEVKKGNWID